MPDVYICNLAVADVVHVTVMPFLIHQWARGGHWVFGSTLCRIITSLDNCNQVACAAVMTAVSLDRSVLKCIGFKGYCFFLMPSAICKLFNK